MRSCTPSIGFSFSSVLNLKAQGVAADDISLILMAENGLGLVYGGGNVGLMGAIVIGFVAGFACLWGVHGLKKMLGADDTLDVFGVHGVGGIVGALLTGVFNTQSLGGPGLVTDWVTASVGSVGDSYDNALAETINGLYKAEVIHRHDLTVPESHIVSRVAAQDFHMPLRWAEGRSRDTRENAQLTLPLLADSGVKRVVLVAKLHVNQHVLPVKVRDLSKGGVRVRTA